MSLEITLRRLDATDSLPVVVLRAGERELARRRLNRRTGWRVMRFPLLDWTGERSIVLSLEPQSGDTGPEMLVLDKVDMRWERKPSTLPPPGSESRQLSSGSTARTSRTRQNKSPNKAPTTAPASTFSRRKLGSGVSTATAGAASRIPPISS